jgi:hypothetical protein
MDMHRATAPAETPPAMQFRLSSVFVMVSYFAFWFAIMVWFHADVTAAICVGVLILVHACDRHLTNGSRVMIVMPVLILLLAHSLPMVD